jgi:hypothetical protein
VSIWIRAISTRSVGVLSKLDLRAATRDADFMTWGEDYDVDEDESMRIEDALRFEASEDPDVVLMHWRPDATDRFIRVERWVGAAAKEELDELVERIADVKGKAADRIRGVLAKATETIAFELKLSDAQGMGWPISWQTAMWLAERGAGLVVTDDPDEWWDPKSYEIILEE